MANKRPAAKSSSTQTQTVSLPRHARSASVRVDTFTDDDNGVDIVFTTGADVLRCDWLDGTYIERLETGPQNVRLDRLNAGAAFLDTHNSFELGAMIGSVVPGSARMENGQGLCRVLLSRSDRAADTVQDIRDGVIRNVSVGYNVYAFTRTEAADGSPAIMIATDWEPCEISAVPVPADPGAQVQAVRAATRSASGVELHECKITRAADSALSKEAVMADNEKSGTSGDKLDDAGLKTDPVPNKPSEKTDAEKAAEKAGIDPKDVKHVDGNKIVTVDKNDITDPGDASPVKIAAEEVRKALHVERERVNTITDLAAKSGFRDLGAEHVRAGTVLADFRNLLMEKMFEQRAKDGGPTGAALVEVETLAGLQKNDRAAGEAAARAVLGKK